MGKLKLLMILLVFIFLLISCDSGQSVDNRNIASTYLGNVNIAELQLGASINDIDLTVFLPTERNNVRYTYLFEEIGLITDTDGKLIYIHGWVLEAGVDFSINGKTLNTIAQITEELGEHYNDYWFDREQSMRAVTYTDKENNINLTLVYFEFNDALVWIILS